MTDPASTPAGARAADLRGALLAGRNRLEFATESLTRLSADVPPSKKSVLEGVQLHLDTACRHIQAALTAAPAVNEQPPADASAAPAVPYDVRGPQGSFDRFLVYVRVNADLEQRPSTDTKLAPVVWSADGPYGAMAAATAWAMAQGLHIRHVFGIVEWPRTADEDSE